MKHILYSLILICSIILASSCEEEQKPEAEQPTFDYIITAGTVCGWCAGTDSIELKNASFCYAKYSPCDTNGVFNSDTCGKIDSALWQQMIDLIDYQALKKLDLNSCNVCADGCDYWIRIETPTDSHKIRFGYEELEELAPLIDMMEKLKKIYLASGNEWHFNY